GSPQSSAVLPLWAWEARVGEIDQPHLLARDIEHGAAQLPAVAMVARLARRARIDNQYLTDTAHKLLVRVAVQHDIGLGLAKPREKPALGMNIGAARLPWGRMHQQHPPAIRGQFAAVRLGGEPFGEGGVDPVAPPGAHPLRPEKIFLMVSEDNLRLPLLQELHDFVRE